MGIRLNPNAEGGGGAVPPPPPPTPTVQLSPAEFQQLLADRAERDQFRTEKDRLAVEEEQKQLRIMAEKGQVEEAFAQFRTSQEKEIQAREQKAATYRDRLLRGERDTVLARALIGFTWRDDFAGAQAAALLSPALDSVEGADGSVQVVERTTRRPAAEWIKDQMASPAYAGFLKATTTGGAGGGGGNPPPEEKKKTLHELIQEGRRMKAERDGLPASTAHGASMGL